MELMIVCGFCGSPVNGATLCLTCTSRLVVACRNAEEVAGDLEVTRSRQDRLGSTGGGGKRTTQPLPYSPAAAEASEVLRDTLGAWVAACGPQAPQGASVALLARLLASRVKVARRLADAGDLLEEVEAAVVQSLKAIDRPVPQWSAGTCRCGQHLRPTQGETIIECPICGTRYDARDRKADLLRQAEERLLNTRDLSLALAALDLNYTPSAIRGYVARGKLQPSEEVARNGAALYRLGDLLDLVLTPPS